MRRRLVLILAVVLAAVALLVATVPFWLGAAAAQAGRSRGLTFGRYERLGYSRFALHDVEFRQRQVRVTASRIEAETPVIWLWHHWRENSAEISVGTWRVEVARNPTPPPPKPDRGWVQLRTQLRNIAAKLDQWLPRARTGAGLVRWPGGEIAVDSARWAGRELQADGLAYRTLKANAVLSFPAEADALRLAARVKEDEFVATLESRGPAIEGEVLVWQQRAKLDAGFAPQGWLPTEAILRAENWTLAGERLKLGNLYASVRGSAQVEWRAERFIANISAAGEPLREKSAPPLQLAIRGQGDAAAFTIEAFDATLPGVTARLSEPVTIERSGKIRESAARFDLVADLTKQPWVAAKGTVRGEARLVSGIAAAPVVEFSLDARDVTARDVALSSVQARGRFEWPAVTIAAGSLVGGDGERLAWRGGWDFRKKEVLEAVITGQIRRQSIARWAPKQPEFDVVKIDAQAAGPIAQLRHAGRASADGVKLSGVNPFAATIAWRGSGAAVEQFDAEAVAASTKIVVGGSVTSDSAALSTLEFVQAGETRLKLAQPATLRWRPALEVAGLQLTGPTANLRANATLGETGRLEIAAKDISSRWISDLVALPGPAWQLTLLGIVGSWDRGPMALAVSAGAALEIAEGRSASIVATARGDKDGLRIEALRATEGSDTVVNASGRLPVTLVPGGRPLLRIDPDGRLLVDASVAPNSAFWQKLASISGVELQEPKATAHLSGTWKRPEGSATLQAARIAIDPRRVQRPLPTIESLDVQVKGDPAGVTLERFALRVEGQAVRAEGRLPVPDGQWGALFKDPLAAAKRGADFRIEVPEAEVAVFARFLPAVLAPQGRVQADLHYRSGGLEGFLTLREAASRPLGPLGVLQEISADIAMSDRKFALRGVTARSGGQPVTLSGTVELPDNAQPIFDLSLKGENLPFVRQTGMLLRGDLDLKLQTPRGAAPRLSGTVKLRDSLFLSDVRAFLPKGGAASPTRRPPYFAIETPPVEAWTLAVEVIGDEFMRLRTPVFTGVASAQFRLTGTLGEPRAIGEVRLDQGRIRMPFASFEVMQGSVRLTEADPFEPAIYLRGTGRRWGYDLTMEIEGSAAQPNVTFTSSPPLDSEQVLLMVMTGTAPSNEIAKSGTQRMASIGYFIGQSLLSSLGSDAADADRLSIASGEKISGQGKETYDIEYKLSDRWTLTGEYNEFDEYNAGVKWRVLRGGRAGEAEDHAKK